MPEPRFAAWRARVEATLDRWLPDPLGRAPERLWNGTRWTAHVRDQAGAYWSAEAPALAALATPTEPRPI